MSKDTLVVGSILKSRKTVQAGKSSTCEVLAVYDDAVRVRHLDGTKKGVHILNMKTLRRYEVAPVGQLPLPQERATSNDQARIDVLEKRVVDLETRLSSVADLFETAFRMRQKVSTTT